MLTRDQITDAITQKLSLAPEALAAWVAGSAAFHRLDEWSDIDLSVLAAQGQAERCFSLLESIFTELSPIALVYPVPNPMPGMVQRFYRLRDTTEYLLLDVCIFEPQSPDLYLDEKRHGKAIVLFDKEGRVVPPPFDEAALQKKLSARISLLQKVFDIFFMMAKKELLRGNEIDALECYRSFTLRPLVELLRIKHDPARHDYYVRYIRYDLPEKEQALLKELFFVGSAGEILEKQKRAAQVFQETLQSLSSYSK